MASGLTARAPGPRALGDGHSTFAGRSRMTGDHAMRLNLQLRWRPRDTEIPRRGRCRQPAVDLLEDRQLLSGGHDVLDIGDNNDNTVKQFDATTGAYLGTLVSSGSGGLAGPRG